MPKAKTTAPASSNETPAAKSKSFQPVAPVSQTADQTKRPLKAGNVQPAKIANVQPANAPNDPASGSATTSIAPGVVEPGEDVELVEREQMIRQAAYHRYLQRNGAPGNPDDDWRAAEAEIDRPGPQTDGKRQRT